MTTFTNGESGSSVRTKINAAISTVDGLGSGDNLLLTAAERAKLGYVTVTGSVNLDSDFALASDNTEDVTLAGTPNYLTLSGQEITLGQVDLAADVTGVLPVANFATGTPDGTKFVRDDGTLQSIPGGGDALTTNPLSQFAATTSLQLKGVISDETGSGALVFATSPALVTPDLGTPSALTLTNATGLPASGISSGTLADARVAESNVTQHEAALTVTESQISDLGTYATQSALSSTSNGQGASLIGIEDSGALISATTVEGALAEIAAAVSAGGTADTRYTAYNGTGSTISKGSPVTVTGFNAGSPSVVLSDADGAGLMPCHGIAIADITNTSTGAILMAGELTGIDTSSYSIGDVLYVSTTAGDFTTTSPTTGFSQAIATVTRSDASLGEILVKLEPAGQAITALTENTAPDGTEEIPTGDDEKLGLDTLAAYVRGVEYSADSGSTKTLALSDRGKTFGMTNGTAATVTIPTNATVAAPVGFACAFTADGAGTITMTAASGVTLNGVSAGSTTISTAYRGVVVLHKIGTDAWAARGDCAAVA